MSVPIVSSPDRQRILDAALPLQMLRNRLCADWERSLPADVGVELHRDPHDAQKRVWDMCRDTRELVAVSQAELLGIDHYRRADRVDQEMVAAGARYSVLVNTSRSFHEAALSAQESLELAELGRS